MAVRTKHCHREERLPATKRSPSNHQTTAKLQPATRRKVALRAVLIAAFIGVLFVFIGSFLMDLFHFSLATLLITGFIALGYRRQLEAAKVLRITITS